MEIEITILFGCTTAIDTEETEYNIEGVIAASPSAGLVELNGICFKIKEGEKHKAIITGQYSLQIIKDPASRTATIKPDEYPLQERHPAQTRKK